MADSCVIIGGGGHAEVLIDCIQSRGNVRIEGVLDADQSRWGRVILGVPILGGDDLLQQMPQRGVKFFVVGVGSIGDNRIRQRLFELGLKSGLAPLTVIHPSVILSSGAKVGPGSQIFPGSVVNAGAVVGCNVIINSGAIVEHDCMIGNHVHIATGAKLASTVQIGTGAHIGVGAVVRQCMRIGEYACVGAGAVVISEVPPWTVFVGNPARRLRREVK
jgi:sugar O-acyltransferase (sialic acid O-acetyltransferase NeuD family)